MNRLGDRLVNDAMFRAVKDTKSRGGKCYLIVGDGETGCTNCNGHRYLHLEILVGGPFDVQPVSIASNDETVLPTWIDGAWYKSIKKGYPCPVCNSGQVISTGQLEALFAEAS